MFVEGLVSIIMLAALCGAAVVPVEKTVIQLTASDADNGNWKANMGEMEINIEHEHNGGSNTNGTWTITMARTFYDKEEDVEQNNSQGKTNESETISTFTPEIEDNKLPEDEEEEEEEKEYEEKEEEEEEVQDKLGNFVPEELSNITLMVETTTKENYNERDYYSSDYPNDSQQAIDDDNFGQNSDNSDSQEVVLDSDNFEYFKGVGWFKLDSRPKSWENAKDACLSVGAHLAAPDTQERVGVFLKLFQKYPEIPRTAILRDQVYVGVNDPLHNRVFTTVQGHIFNPDFPIWFPNEPNNESPGEYCVTFHIEGKTRDVPCYFRLPFFCEKDLPVTVDI